MSQKIAISRSEFAESFFWLNGAPFSLDDYPHMRRVWDTSPKKKVMQFSRQTAKSTTMAGMVTANSGMIPFFKTLYVAPTITQAKIFSHDRVKPFLEGSPFMKDHYMNTSLVDNVHHKELANGSLMHIRYALLSADKLRGFSADMNIFDECQDMLSEIIPVVQETMTHSDYKWIVYSGTPKRSRGTLADLWHKSTMCEYIVKCQSCNHWNILDEENIGDFGVICKKCGRPLDISVGGEWVSTYSLKNPTAMEGYRVCALHFAKAPWVNWQEDILDKQRHWSKAFFHNEVLALEYDAGVSPVTEFEIDRASTGPLMEEDPNEEQRNYPRVLAIDYGPVNSEKSYTVAVVMQLRSNKLRVVYAKKFIGKEADYSFIVPEIPKIMAKWNCVSVASDYGMGEAPNSELRARIGYEKVVAFQHSGTQKNKIQWNDKMPAYTLNRTKVMTEFFENIKNLRIEFPHTVSMDSFKEDIMNIQIDYDEERGFMKYINIGPDDFAHACIFGTIACELMFGAVK